MPSSINGLRGGSRLLRLLALTFVVWSGLSLSPVVRAQATPLGETAPVRNEAGDMECVSYCSVTRPGTPLMEVKWKLASQPLTTKDLVAKSAQQGLEATVYAEGFERGQYVVVSALKPQALFHAVPKSPNATAPPSKLPGLENLKVTEIATRASKPARVFHLLRPQTQTETAEPAEWMAVRIEGVDPGMQYTYRISGNTSTVACQTVVCPVDRITLPKTQPKSKSTTPPTPK